MNSVRLRLYASKAACHKNGPPMKARKLLLCDSGACIVPVQKV
jgi:hypothetical protein